ncbi:TetR/AcrR family transcriptional regulator [Gilvibacter sediminis]|uniref:TetR/AcrR family transcriptional regulator n=1 Tax=Gilvibacter sediminis TaxID=379071 RepID=UPI002350DAEF|nr:TetR/AcrR family transcriptional regulator [Gilvibacter sediminis]MDC7996544.1 TetR/AcrR family transcriptional regulator [Gilvibacter sediminis]
MKKNYVSSGRTNQKLETRAKILEAAQHFLSSGKEFKLEDVAKHVKVSRATIYRYFSSVEILAAETSLAIATIPPKDLAEQVQDQDLEDRLLQIQEYFNTLTLDHEAAFRKYLSVVIESSAEQFKRGARRTKALNFTLAQEQFPTEDKKKLANIITLFMGLEPIIVAKDVCDLDNKESRELLTWGMKLLLKGYLSQLQE